jgi:hypothetical protein
MKLPRRLPGTVALGGWARGRNYSEGSAAQAAPVRRLHRSVPARRWQQRRGKDAVWLHSLDRCGCPGHRRGGQCAAQQGKPPIRKACVPVPGIMYRCTETSATECINQFLMRASVTVSRPWLLLFRRSNGQNKAVCNWILFLGVDRCCSCSLLAHAVVLYSFTSTYTSYELAL